MIRREPLPFLNPLIHQTLCIGRIYRSYLPCSVCSSVDPLADLVLTLSRCSGDPLADLVLALFCCSVDPLTDLTLQRRSSC